MATAMFGNGIYIIDGMMYFIQHYVSPMVLHRDFRNIMKNTKQGIRVKSAVDIWLIVRSVSRKNFSPLKGNGPGVRVASEATVR